MPWVGAALSMRVAEAYVQNGDCECACTKKAASTTCRCSVSQSPVQ